MVVNRYVNKYLRLNCKYITVKITIDHIIYMSKNHRKMKHFRLKITKINLY